MLDAILVTARVTTVLDKFQVRYLIGGSLASTVHGMLRTTQDADMVAELGPEQIAPFVRELEGEFYIDEVLIVEAVAQFSSFNIIHRESFFKVDIFIPKKSLFTDEQFRRAQRQVLSVDPKIEAVVATAEDTLLAKLEWYRKGGEVSERQWRDVHGVIKVQAGALDVDYLYQMADELGVKDLLEKVLSED